MTLLEMVKAIGAANRIAEHVATAQALGLYDAGPLSQVGSVSAMAQARAELAELNALLASETPFKNAPNPRATTEAIDVYQFPGRASLAAAVERGQRDGGYDGE